MNNKCIRKDCVHNSHSMCMVLKSLEPNGVGCKSFFETHAQWFERRKKWLKALEKRADTLQFYRDRLYNKEKTAEYQKISVDEEIEDIKRELRDNGYDIQ